MKLQRLRYFVTLSETLNFSRTAEIHCVSQTTVSQQVQLLEKELGCELFERTKRRVQLTAAGRVYLEGVRAGLAALDAAEEKVRLLRAGERTQLRLALAHGLTPGYVAGPLGAFGRANPDVELVCSYVDAVDLCTALLRGDADAGLTFDLDAVERPGVAKAGVCRLQQYVVVAAGSRLAAHARLARDQLVGERCVNGIESRALIPVSHGDPGRGADNTDVVVSDMDALLLSVSLGEGYTLLCEPMACSLDPGLNLAAVPLEGETVPLVACWRSEDAGPAVHRFVGAVVSGWECSGRMS